MVYVLITDIGDDGRGVKKDFRGLKSKVLVCELGHQVIRAKRNGGCSRRNETCYFCLPPGFIDLEREAV